MNKYLHSSVFSKKAVPVFLGVAVLVFYAKVATFAGVLFHFDLLGFNVPIREFFFKHIAGGQFPLWCPNICGGFPFFAEGQAGPLYPLNYLFFTFLPAGISLNLTVLVHAFIAIFGIYTYLRRSHGTGAAAVGALSYTFCSFIVFHLVHLMWFQSASLLPWMAFFFDRYLTDGKKSDVIGAGAMLALMFTTGNPQVPMLAAVGFGLYGAFLAAEAFLAKRKIAGVKILGSGAAVGIFALAATAVIFYGFADLMNHSVRSEALEKNYLYSHSIQPDMLARLASPNLNGRAKDDTWWLSGYFEKEVAVYLGLGAFLFAALAFVGRAKRRDRAHLAVVLFGLLYIMGRAGPFSGLNEHVPLLNRMGMPPRFMLPVFLSLSFLIASGVDRLTDEKTNRKAANLVMLGGTIFWALLAWGGALKVYGTKLFAKADGVMPPRVLETLQNLRTDLLLRSVLVLAMAAVATALLFRPAKKTWVKTGGMLLLGLLVFADLYSAGAGENPVANPAIYGPFETTRFLESRLGDHRIFSFVMPKPEGVPTVQDGGWAKGTDQYRNSMEGLPFFEPLLFNLPTVGCRLPLAFSRNRKVIQNISLPWFQQLSVKYVLSAGDLGPDPKMNTGRVKIYEIPNPAPMYQLARRVIPVLDSKQAYDATGDSGGKFTSIAFVEDAPEQLPIGPPVGSVQLLEDEPDRRVLRVKSDNLAFMLARVNYHEGWRAFVDGYEYPVYRANYLFFGLFVPEGTHEIKLVYRPGYFKPLLIGGLVLFFAGIALALFFAPFKKSCDPILATPQNDFAGKVTFAVTLSAFVLLIIVAIFRHPELWKLIFRT